MQKNNFIKFISIFFISFTLVTACADEPMQQKEKTILDNITTLVHKKPTQIQDIENTLGFKFGKIDSDEYFNTATASKEELNTTKFSSIEYKYGFQKNNPLGLLIVNIKNMDCITKESVIKNFGKDFSRYIPTIHHWSKKEVNNPYGEIAEYYSYGINRVKVSIGFPVNPKTGMPVSDACISEFIINYDELK